MILVDFAYFVLFITECKFDHPMFPNDWTSENALLCIQNLGQSSSGHKRANIQCYTLAAEFGFCASLTGRAC